MESLIAALPPILSAAITGIVTYLATRSNAKLSMSEKEYNHVEKERQYITDTLKNIISDNKLEIQKLQATIIELHNKLQIADDAEEECQRKLLQHQYRIRELEIKLNLNK